MSTPQNFAAVLHRAGSPFVVEPAPYTPPGPKQIVISTQAIGVAPVDVYIQKLGTGVFPWLKFPLTCGIDVSGVIHQVGNEVAMGSSFKPGDRVMAPANGIINSVPAEGGYQKYVVVEAELVAKIPLNVGFDDAAMLPLSISTAAMGLYGRDMLGLRYPDADVGAEDGGLGNEMEKKKEEKKKGKEYVLFWGGGTTIAAVGIQLARASGYGVVVTASLKHSEYLKSLGAEVVLDYKSPTVMDELKEFFATNATVGAMACAPGTVLQCAEVMKAAKTGRKFVVMVSKPSEEEQKLVEGVEGGFPFGDMRGSDAAAAIWEKFLPAAMENGTFKPAPKKLVVGKGLGCLNDAMSRWEQGVSGQKVIVSLEE